MGIAHELITRGWHQRDYRDEDGRVCLMGAAACAAGYEILPVPGQEHADLSWDINDDAKDSPEACAVVKALTGRAAGVSGENPIDIVAVFNDAPERTFDEVLRVAKEADELLEAQS